MSQTSMVGMPRISPATPASINTSKYANYTQGKIITIDQITRLNADNDKGATLRQQENGVDIDFNFEIKTSTETSLYNISKNKASHSTTRDYIGKKINFEVPSVNTNTYLVVVNTENKKFQYKFVQ